MNRAPAKPRLDRRRRLGHADGPPGALDRPRRPARPGHDGADGKGSLRVWTVGRTVLEAAAACVAIQVLLGAWRSWLLHCNTRCG